MLSRHWFVSQHGDDLNDCANWTMSCHTVRHAVKISRDGDEIYIDYAQGRPYMECKNLSQSSCSIELNKNISFHGKNGRPIIKCKKSCKLFVINNLELTKVAFYNLEIQSTCMVAECTQAKEFELLFESTVITDNYMGIHSKNSTNCFIRINNSRFEEKAHFAIHLNCTNLIAHITHSEFKKSPILLKTMYKREYKNHLQILEVFVRNCVFDGEKATIPADLFSVLPYAIIFNVSIWESIFINHRGMASKGHFFSLLQINDQKTVERNVTYVSLRNITVENSSNRLPAVNVTAFFNKDAHFMFEIRSSIFKNNSAALVVDVFNANQTYNFSEVPNVVIYNNTFTENFNGEHTENSVPAIFFAKGKFQVISSRFYNNKAGKSPFSAVVTVSESSKVSFSDCYFENRQTVSSATQFYAIGQSSVSFIGRNIFNISDLNAGQAVFLRIPFHATSGVVLNKHFEVLCPQGFGLNFQKACKVFPGEINCTYIYMYITCVECPSETYTLKRAHLIYNRSNNIKCKQCPAGGNCIGGIVKAKPNFWGYKTNTSITFAHCPPGYCCDSNNCNSYDSCHGNRTGTLCGRCPKGMSDSLFSSQCIPNTNCSWSLFIPSAVTILVLQLVFFLYHEEIANMVRKNLFGSLRIFKARQQTDKNVRIKEMQSSGLLKVIFYYYQVVRLLQSVVGPQDRNPIIGRLEDIIGRILNMVLIDISSFSCPIQNLQPVQKAAILHSVGYCLLALLGILYLITTVILLVLKRTKSFHDEMRSLVMDQPQTRPSKFKARIASAFTYISLLMYASSAQLCLSLLHCVPVDGDQVLFLDGNIKCYQTFQYVLLAYVVSSVLPFCLVPVLGAYLLKMDRISVAQFCIACIFPLPFCCAWAYLLVKNYRLHEKTINDTNESSTVIGEIHENRRLEGQNEVQSHCRACEINGNHEESSREHETCLHHCCSTTSESNESTTNEASEQHIIKVAILRVLLGSFRPHKAFLLFPSSILPWEGYLIFRRLALILVLTFVHDNWLKMMITLILCVAILTSHVYIKPFIRPRDNAIEALSLFILTVLCAFTLIKSLFYSQNVSLMSDHLSLIHFFNLVENILVVAPLVILVIVILSVVGRLLLLVRGCLKYCKRGM